MAVVTPALGFALLTLMCAALNDVVFKEFGKHAAQNGGSVGWFISVVGFTIVMIEASGLRGVAELRGNNAPALYPWHDATARYAPLLGLTIAAANVALVEAMRGVPASAGSTIYRLNSIGVVLGSWMWLSEPMGALKLGGVSAGIVAVLILYTGSRMMPPLPSGVVTQKTMSVPVEHGTPLRKVDLFIEDDDEKLSHSIDDVSSGSEQDSSCSGVTDDGGGFQTSSNFFYLVAIAASLLRSAYGLMSKKALEEGADTSQLVLAAGLCWLLVGAVFALVRERSTTGWRDTRCLALGAVCGVLQLGNIAFLNLALSLGDASDVVPVANCSFALTVIIAVCTGMEQLDKYKAAAICAAILCIVLLAKAAAHGDGVPDANLSLANAVKLHHNGTTTFAELANGTIYRLL